MGKALPRLSKLQGIQFYKTFGSGAGNGFSIFPDFSVYGILAVWQSRQHAENFTASEFLMDFNRHSTEQWTVLMQPAGGHGQWEGSNPFGAATGKILPGQPVAVLTRATIKWRYLYQFWKRVPSVSEKMGQYPGKIFSAGIGELPLVQQATFSIWQNLEAMKDYAYRNPRHMQVIKKTRELGWYSEEMFMRFRLHASAGTWSGANPLQHLLAPGLVTSAGTASFTK